MQVDREKGIAWEEDFARQVGGRLSPGSGNTWHTKLDVRDTSIQWSLKSTKHASFSVSIPLIREVVLATEGPGGTGAIPALALRLAHDEEVPTELVVLRKDDFIKLLTERPALYKASKAEAKRARARVPILLRKDDE